MSWQCCKRSSGNYIRKKIKKGDIVKKERKHNYVVGFEGDGECVYGQSESDEKPMWVDLLTLSWARWR